MKPVIKAKCSALSSSSYRWDAYKTSQTSNHNLSTRIKIDNMKNSSPENITNLLIK